MATARAEILIKIEGQMPVRHVLGPGDYVIGRDESACHVRVASDTVSRQHARLVVGEGQFHLEDLGSTLGTFVNGEQVTQRTLLSSAQKVHLGNATLEFRFIPAESSTPEPEEALQGRHYQIGKAIAQGGMGAILSAQDLKIERAVAMKVIRSDRGPVEREGRQRFIREAKVIGRLEHPNIVPIHELGVNEQGQVFYTMKLVKGVTLRQVLSEIKKGHAATLAKHPLSQLLTVFQKVCDAMAFAHAQGVIHRDLKPENIMLGEFGEVLVMDWGLAKILSESGAGASPREEQVGRESERGGIDKEVASSPQPSPPLGEEREMENGPALEGFREQNDLGGGDGLQTMEGAIMGTPSFMAPEQVEGKVHEMDGRTDIFALGGILYSILTLRAPATGTTMAEMLANIKSGYIAPPVYYNQSRKDTKGETIALAHCPDGKVPEALSAVAMKALATLREARYQTVEDLQQDLAAYQGGFATSAEQAGAWKLMLLSIKRHKTVFSLAAAAIIIILSLAAVFTWKVTNTLSELRGTAPTFYREAQTLIEQQNLTNALERIGYAITLQPREANYHALKGNILQSQLKLAEARDAYAKALQLKGDHPQALENRRLCEKLLKDNPGAKELTAESLDELRTAMLAQGRSTEAIAMGQRSGKSTEDTYAKWKAVFDRTTWKGRLTKNPDNTVSLTIDDPLANDLGFIKGMPLSDITLTKHSITNLTPLRGSSLKVLAFSGGTAITNLAALQGLPLKILRLSGCTNVTDLTPLKGMLLDELDARNCKNLEDLRPLKGMPISGLRLGDTKVSDINPLKGMPLRLLDITRCNVNDLSALEGMPLEELQIFQCSKINDLRPLKGMKLRNLDIGSTQLADIGILKGMPLTTLQMSGTKVTDISSLEGAPLTTLKIDGTKVTSLEPLKDSPLTDLSIQGTPVKDLTPLQYLRLTRLYMSDTQVRDLTPLKGVPLTFLVMNGCQVTNLSPLQGKKLTDLHANGTKVQDLTPLKGMPLNILSLIRVTGVSDLSPLQGAPLSGLYLSGTQVSDLSVLKDMPLGELDLSGCKLIKDLGPLAYCRTLGKVGVPRHLTNLDPLRNLYDLKFISFTSAENGWPGLLPAAEFWKAYDARKK